MYYSALSVQSNYKYFLMNPGVNWGAETLARTGPRSVSGHATGTSYTYTVVSNPPYIDKVHQPYEINCIVPAGKPKKENPIQA